MQREFIPQNARAFALSWSATTIAPERGRVGGVCPENLKQYYAVAHGHWRFWASGPKFLSSIRLRAATLSTWGAAVAAITAELDGP